MQTANIEKEKFMRICDICKSESVSYHSTATVDDKGHTKQLELCRRCYFELDRRKTMHLRKAYEEAVQAITGENPPKLHWWNMIDFDLL
jgi:hypothetical protein